MRSPAYPSLLPVIALLGILAASSAQALPTGGKAVKGSIAVSTSGSIMNVVQRSNKENRAIVNWNTFNVASRETLNFQQPNARSLLVNRVVGLCSSLCHSMIDGTVTANGNIMLINPNGILFGPTARVDVNGLAATTIDFSNLALMSVGPMLSDLARNRAGFVVNNGSLTVRSGLVALVAPGVENNGVIMARGGQVALASGKKFSLDFYGDGMVQLAMSSDAATDAIASSPGGLMGAAVTNRGTIIADGGVVALTARVAAGVLDTVINTSGVIQAQSAITSNGKIVLHGGDNAWVQVSGTLDASGGAGLSGGSIDVLGEKIVLGQLSTAGGKPASLSGGATIDATGGAGAGLVRVGGDESQLPLDASGTGGVKLSTQTIVGKISKITGDGRVTGYVVYQEGDMPLVVASVHGGMLKPGYIAPRDCTGVADCSISADLKTKELASEIVSSMAATAGATPHLIVVNLHRSRVDANRAPGFEDGTSIEGQKAWNAAHDLIDLASGQVQAAHGGRGLLVDVHGMSDPSKGLAIGYVVPGSVLNNLSDAQLNASSYAGSSSFAAVGRDSMALGGSADFARVLRGDLSLGALLASRTDYYGGAYNPTPSPMNPGPGSGQYFSGGYVTQRHGSGSTNGPTLDAVQVEVTSHYRQDSDAAQSKLAGDLAASLRDFLRLHYGFTR